MPSPSVFTLGHPLIESGFLTFLSNPSEHLMTIQEECHHLKEWDDRAGSRCAECEYIRELFHT